MPSALPYSCYKYVVLLLALLQAIDGRQYSLSLPYNVEDMSGAVINTTVIFAGGFLNPNPIAKVFAFDAATGAILTAANLSEGRLFMATSVVGSSVFFMGGSNTHGPLNVSSVVDIYTFPEMTHSRGPDLPTPLNFMFHGTNGSPFSKVAVAAQSNKLFVLNATSVTAFNLSISRTQLSSVTVTDKDGHLLTVVVGGFPDFYATLDTIELYNHSSNSMVPNSLRLSLSRYSTVSVFIKPYLIVIGGNILPDNKTDVVDVFDMNTMTLVKTYQMLIPRAFFEATTLGRYVYIFGSCNSQVDLLDTSDWTFYREEPLIGGHSHPVGVGVPGEGVFIAGGYMCADGMYDQRITYYTCGNDKVEPWEVCDKNSDTNCAACRGCKNGMVPCGDGGCSSSCPCSNLTLRTCVDNVPEDGYVFLSCGCGIISSVRFANFGNSTGSCASQDLAAGSCSSSNSVRAINTKCMGKSSCLFKPNSFFFGSDPCLGTVKRTDVSVTCSFSSPIADSPSGDGGVIAGIVYSFLHFRQPPFLTSRNID